MCSRYLSIKSNKFEELNIFFNDFKKLFITIILLVFSYQSFMTTVKMFQNMLYRIKIDTL